MAKKILLVGGNGFIGKNLIKYAIGNILSDGDRISVLTRSTSNETFVHDQVEYFIGDYIDNLLLDKLFSENKFDAVFHLVSTTIPILSNNNIRSEIQDNLLPTINLLETMSKYGCNFIMYLSSGGAVYGEFANDRLQENHPCKPISSYGIVKLASENYIQLFHKQFGIEYLILRISNPYGPFHTSDKQGVINIAIRKALKSEPFVIWGNGEQSKDYIFVEDIAFIVWRLFQNDIKNQILNVGSGTSISLNSITEQIKLLIPEIEILYENANPSDVRMVTLDIEKIKNYVDFEPTPLKTGLMRTLAWEKND